MSDDEPRPPTKVDITVAGHQVIVEAAESLDTVAAKALELFEKTAEYAKRAPIGFATVGGQFERAPATPYEDPDWEPA